MPETRKMNIAIDGDLVAWVSYAAGLDDTSMTAYINKAIRRDRDTATGDIADGYQAFLKARGESK
jgi:hypothetical protein